MPELEWKIAIRTKANGTRAEHRQRLRRYLAAIAKRLPESNSRRSELEFREILPTLTPFERDSGIRRGNIVPITRETLNEIMEALQDEPTQEKAGETGTREKEGISKKKAKSKAKAKPKSKRETKATQAKRS